MSNFKNTNQLILRDENQQTLGYVEVESLNNIENEELTFKDIISILHNPIISHRFRISILNPDETVSYIIPSEDIVEGSLSYSETYQQGQRRNLTFKLINSTMKYFPIVNKGNKYYKINIINQDDEFVKKKLLTEENKILIWKNTLFQYDIGIKYNETILWFKKGIYCLGSCENSNSGAIKELTIQLKDKFARFENNTGKLLNSYEITAGVLARQVIQDLLNQDFGNGYQFDIKPFFLDSTLYDFKIQTDIKKEAGDNFGTILLEIATQMSAECYYNENGNLLFLPLDETLNDNGKSTCWQYQDQYPEIFSLTVKHDFENVINMVKVIGDNVDTGIYSALVVNNDPRSPICIGNIGKCPDDIITNANVWSNESARDLGRYTLRKKSLIPLSVSMSVKLNPLLTVDRICEVNNLEYKFKREKFVINSLSYSDTSLEVSMEVTNIQDLQFVNSDNGGYDE